MSSAQLNVDGVLCISLHPREDRRALLRQQFAQSGLPIEFIFVDKDTEDPQRGCYHSHQHCARLALERGYTHTLILEDDATLEAWPARTIQRLNRFLQHRNPELLYLGVILGQLWLTWHPGIARCKGAGTHAYILSRPAAEKLLTLPYTNQGIDTVYRKKFRQYCAFPMLSQQQPEHIAASDINIVRKHYDNTRSWQYNTRKQYREALQNLWKTLFHINH